MTVTLLATWVALTTTSMVRTLVVAPHEYQVAQFSSVKECEAHVAKWHETTPQVFDASRGKLSKIPAESLLEEKYTLRLVTWCVPE